MTPDVQAAIVQAAQEQGIDPAFALAVAQRESNFNPNARASRTIYGLFQMSGHLRSQYGIGDSSDPYAQATGWGHFINDTRNELAQRLGRDPTNEETYLAHYFGTGRAARLISGQVPGSADVRDVFTPQEIEANPEFARAGTVGRLVASVEGDMSGRQAKFGGAYNKNVISGPDFASFGQPQDGGTSTAANATKPREQPIDFAQFGSAPTNSESALALTVAPPSQAALDNAAAMSAPQETAAAPAEPEPPQGVPNGGQMTPAAAAMRQAMMPPPAPIAGIPAMPGQQAQTPPPLQPQQGTA